MSSSPIIEDNVRGYGCKTGGWAGSLQWPHIAIFSPTIYQGNCAGLFLEKSDELRGGASESDRRLGDVGIQRGDDVQGLGQQRGKIIVGRIHSGQAARGSLFPEIAGAVFGIDGPANVDCQVKSEPKDRGTAIGGLASPLTRLGLHPGVRMQQPDARLDLVAMLSAGPGAAKELDLACPQEFVRVDRGGMGRRGGHLSKHSG